MEIEWEVGWLLFPLLNSEDTKNDGNRLKSKF